MLYTYYCKLQRFYIFHGCYMIFKSNMFKTVDNKHCGLVLLKFNVIYLENFSLKPLNLL